MCADLELGTTLFEAQAPSFHMSVPHVADSISGGIFLQGPGGVFAIPFAQRYGRYDPPNRVLGEMGGLYWRISLTLS
jgi:hypothetical protein